MAKDIDCSACEELRENAPNFVQNGITDTECNSLKNDTGFNPRLTTLHTDCEDLDTANDCLIGMMDGEIEKYEPCDWQKFMHKFIPNLYQLLKAFVCTICGIWTNIHNLWNHVNNLEDRMDVAEHDIDNLQEDVSEMDERMDGICALINNQISPPLRSYGVHPLKTSGSDVGHVTNKVTFHEDDGTLNPYTKTSQGIGIDYARLETTNCATGECTVYEWILPKIFLTYINSGTQNDDVLWYATKAELQAACGFSDFLWTTFTNSFWTWRNESSITNGASWGKNVWLEIGVNAGNVGADKLAVVYHGTSYPFEDTLSYDIYPSALQTNPRLYTHSC